MSGSSYSFKSTALAMLALTASAWAQAACYTVYDSKNEVIYRSAEPPVDMSKPLHQTASELPSGSRVVFTPNHAWFQLQLQIHSTCDAGAHRLGLGAGDLLHGL